MSRRRQTTYRSAGYVLCVKNDGFPASLEVRKVDIDLPVPPAVRRALSAISK